MYILQGNNSTFTTTSWLCIKGNNNSTFTTASRIYTKTKAIISYHMTCQLLFLNSYLGVIGCGGSIGRTFDYSPWSQFKSRQEHKNIFMSFSKSKLLCWLTVGVPNPRVYTGTQEHFYELFRVKTVVLTRCRCTQPPCVYAHTRMITYAR